MSAPKDDGESAPCESGLTVSISRPSAEAAPFADSDGPCASDGPGEADDNHTIPTPRKEHHPASAQDFLVLIHSADGQRLGTRHLLGDEPLTVGRVHGNRLVLDDDSVSRRHCRIEKRTGSWWIIDLESSNGTYVNDRAIREHQLRSGDRVKISGTILKFVSGPDREDQYQETLYRLLITDGLTEVWHKRYLMEVLERAVPRVHQHGGALAVVTLDIDRFKHVNDTYGHLAGDFLLKDVAILVKSRLHHDAFVARYGGDGFLVVLPDASLSAAVALAEDLRRRVEERQFVFDGQAIPLTISVGCAELRSEMDASQLIKSAEERLDEAKRAGRNQVVDDTGPRIHRTFSGPVCVNKLLGEEPVGCLVGFEIEDEVAVMAQLGHAARDAWLRELERSVDGALGATDLLGRWQERYVLAALRRDSIAAGDLIAEVRRRWESSESAVPRRLRAAVLEPNHLVRFQSASLEQLAMKLLGSRTTEARQDLASLPFPLAATAAWVESATSELHRLSALVHAIEVHLQFGVAVGLTLVELDRVGQKLAAMLRDSAQKPLAMGHWRALLASLVKALDGQDPHPAARWLSGLTAKTKLHGESRPLLEHVNRAVGVRNETVGHGAPMAEDAYAADAVYLREVLMAMVAAAEPLKSTSLVSVASADVLDGEEDIAYELRYHSGPSEIFPLQRQRLPHRLGRTWMYLLAQGQPPLALSPIALCATCEACRRTEVFLADSVVLGPEGAIVKASGVTTNHKFQLAGQGTKRAKALHERIRAADPSP